MSAVALSLTSCDEYLSPAPTAAISSETFFQTQEDFDLAVINMYDAIAGLNLRIQMTITPYRLSFI